jgi:hypothetical protein
MDEAESPITEAVVKTLLLEHAPGHKWGARRQHTACAIAAGGAA